MDPGITGQPDYRKAFLMSLQKDFHSPPVFDCIFRMPFAELHSGQKSLRAGK